MVTNSSTHTLGLLRRIWGHLSRRRHLQFALLLIVMLASGVAELISLGAVLPFLVVLNNPDQLWQHPWIKSLALQFGFSFPQQLVLPVTIAFIFSAVFAALVRLLNLWLNSRLASIVGSDLSSEVYRRTLFQPYHVHVQRNSSALISAITQQIAFTVESLNVVLQMMTAIVVAVGLLIGILIIDPFIALSIAGIFGIAYCSVAIPSRRYLKLVGSLISAANIKRVQALQEGLGAIRDVLLDGSQLKYLEVYSRTDRRQRILESKVRFISSFPRYVLECLGLVTIASLGYLISINVESNRDVITLLGGLALGAQRLLPSLQQIYSGWANLNSWNASLVAVAGMLDQPVLNQQSSDNQFVLTQTVRLKEVSFRYSPDSPEVLRHLDLSICRGERIGLIGNTGGGKSTLVDIIMGLLAPSSGQLLVDGIDLNHPKNAHCLSAWRKSVAHVPQSIFLADSSIAENIAFSVPKNEIDFMKVKEAAKLAQLSGFIESSADGYDSFVGERGIRLSGGQRQRIGIARALYKQASIIILDEATSALDNTTENAVMDSVEGLSRDLTMVIIAHRLSTVKRCDRVLRLDNGRVVANGPPNLILGVN